jgi:probable nitrogen fixation protein
MTYTLFLENTSQFQEFDHPFLDELVRQFRLQDTTSHYQNWSDESVLKSLILSSDSSRNRHVRKGEIDLLTRLRVSAYYYAIAAQIERETGQLSEIFINLSNQGLSSALVCCGHLLVISELLQKVGCFGFESLDNLINEAEQLILRAVARVRQFI